jgi:hypothetical protein
MSKSYYFSFIVLIAFPSFSFADGNSISKIEHPYIQSNEKEIALSSFYQYDDDATKDHVLKHTFSVGAAITDDWFIEAAISGKKTADQHFSESSFELEAKWQLTEQGEYSADYGVLFEYENEDDLKLEEVSVSLLTERQWGKWIGTANLKGIYEWGDDIQNEFETALALQAKYRYKPTLEPAIELYAGERNKGIGPVLIGEQRLRLGKKLKWELGVIFGFDNKSPEQTYRALLEYEFK